MQYNVLLFCFVAWYIPSISSFFPRISTQLRLFSRCGLEMGSDHRIASSNGVHSISFEVAGKPMSFETGKIGRQAGGSVMARTMDTMVYSTVCCERESQPVDFTPLRVDFFARYSSVGQTIGAFHRRDSRGDDNEILIARLIDRPIRPMIAEGWQHETQILTWVLSYDKQHSPDALAINAASAAMCISEVPMIKPVAGVEVALLDGEMLVNPTKSQTANATLVLTVAGTKDGILMIEGAADFLSEELMMEALKMGHAAIGTICDALTAFQAVAGKAKKTDTLRKLPAELVDTIDAEYGAAMRKSLSIGDKHARGKSVSDVEKLIVKRFCTDTPPAQRVQPQDEEADPDTPLVDGIVDEETPVVIPPTASDAQDEDEASELRSPSQSASSPSKGKSAAGHNGYNYDPIDVKISTKKLLVRNLRNVILQTGKRSDGRSVEEVRPISIETDFLPGAHGSALFTRGETQSLSTATLGSKAMEMRVETLDAMSSKRFYLQYRFPPSSVGEVGRVGGVNRREVGHGNLAERALMACLPTPEDFPYSIRAESLITESCGSSSMATVCGCCLAMLDSGVPLKTSVAGVAMGLILGEKEGDEPVILTDILGLEDALGTMDFKIAGNETGITTFQLDIKSEGLTIETLQRSLAQAKRGRLLILQEMKSVLASPRPMKDTIPKILSFSIPPECLGKVIGPKGATVTKLIETHKLVNINLDDSGLVQIESFSVEKNEEVKGLIMKIVEGAADGGKSDRRRGSGEERDPPVEKGPPPEEGIVYRACPVTGVQKFGVFVEMLPGYEGLVHLSELDTKKISDPTAAGFAIGQTMDVKYLGKNEKGQMRLSRRAVLMRDAPTTGVIASNVVSSAMAEALYAAPPTKQAA